MTSTSKSVEEICKLIEQYKLMSSNHYAAMRERWFRPTRKEVADVEQFKKWLVLNRYLTEFVTSVLSGRKSDQLVLNQYRLQDQMISGPMAGAYLAIDPVDRHVAIEVLSASSASDKTVLTQFQQTALKAIKVQHPNVGRVLDVGEAHGFYYLVSEYFEGHTVDEICARSGKLPYIQATRLITLALAGLEALHEAGLPAGDLAADCLLLAPASKSTPGQRTVKILHAGVRRRLFDEAAIGRSFSMTQGIPDDLELKNSSTFEVADQVTVNPADDIFRLGCIFYRCVTGKAPYAPRDLPKPTTLAKPVKELAPEVPEMLSQLIDEMIDPAPNRRPQKAANLAKTLRVFLAAEEQAKEVKVEDQIVAPSPRAAVPARAEEEEDEEDFDDEEPADEAETEEKPAREGVWGKAVELWEEINPQPRDIVVFGGGALLMLVLIFLLQFLTGFHLSYIAGLATGAIASFVVDRYLKRREQQRGATA
jgi:serine/threonine protein kinase